MDRLGKERSLRLIELLLKSGGAISHDDASHYLEVKKGPIFEVKELFDEHGISYSSAPEPSCFIPASVASPNSLGSLSEPETAKIRSCNAVLAKAPGISELNKKLIQWVALDNVDRVRQLLRSGADLNWDGYYGSRPLAIAVRNRSLDMVLLLLDSGANPNEDFSDEDLSDEDFRDEDFRHEDFRHEDFTDHERDGFAIGLISVEKESWQRRPPLYLAIENNDIPICRALLEHGADASGFGGENFAPLEVALWHGSDDIIELLFEYDAFVFWHSKMNTAEEDVWEVALIEDNVSDLSILLRAWRNSQGRDFRRSEAGTWRQRFEDYHYTDQNLTLLIEQALSFISPDCVLYLLREGAKVSRIQFNEGDINTDDASLVNRLGQMDEIIMSLVEEGAKVKAWTPVQRIVPILRDIIDRERFALLTFVLREEVTGIPAGEMGKTLPLHQAITSSSPAFALAAAEAFISVGADLNRYDTFEISFNDIFYERRLCSEPYPLQEAIMSGQKPYDSTFEATPIQVACFHGHTQVIKLLLKQGADINGPPAELKGFTALQCLILGDYGLKFKNSVNIDTVIDAGADLNGPAASEVGLTALQASILMQNWKLATKLMELGANVNAPASRDIGCTALQAAVITGPKELVADLLKAGADVNAPAPRNCGRTALQAACFKDNEEVVRMLMDHGADVNALPCHDRGATALQYASMNGNIDLVIQLLEKGANINAHAAHYDGRTAIEGAAEQGRLDIVQVLLQNDPERMTIGEKCEKAARRADKEGHKVVAKCLRAWNDPFSQYYPLAPYHILQQPDE